MFIFDSLLTDLIALAITVTAIVIASFRWRFTYWKTRNVPYLEPSIPFGNMRNLLTTNITLGVDVKNMYNKLKAKNRNHGGVFFFGVPQYIPMNLDYVKHILTKDFNHFVDRGFYYNEKDDPLGAHLFALGGTKWRNLRTKLTPTFTSGKMKMMFQTLVDCEANLHQKMDAFYKSKQPIDIKEVLGCFTTDIIGSCAFGLDCDTFKDDDSPFRKYGRLIFTATNVERVKNAFVLAFPEMGRALRLPFIRKDVSDFFFGVVKDTVQYREKNNVVRKDFMQLLIDMKNNKIVEEDGYAHDGTSLTIEEIAAQSFIFFAGGFETSSTTMTFLLYELARNHDIQDKVREEIETVLEKYDGKITYDGIQELKYMNQVINETLRKYPPLPFITRVCVEDYKVPGEHLVIEKGTNVIVPVLGIHHDEEYYPDPEKFDPERFNEKNSKSRHPYAHIPFGEGPRICIGLRFGLMQTKVGLSSLLKKYKFTVNQKTKEPITFAVSSFILAADGEMWLNAEKINE